MVGRANGFGSTGGCLQACFGIGSSIRLGRVALVVMSTICRRLRCRRLERWESAIFAETVSTSLLVYAEVEESLKTG